MEEIQYILIVIEENPEKVYIIQLEATPENIAKAVSVNEKYLNSSELSDSEEAIILEFLELSTNAHYRINFGQTDPTRIIGVYNTGIIM